MSHIFGRKHKDEARTYSPASNSVVELSFANCLCVQEDRTLAPRISSASDLDRTSKQREYGRRPASDELLISSIKDVPTGSHQRKLDRKARRAQAKAISRAHRREERCAHLHNRFTT